MGEIELLIKLFVERGDEYYDYIIGLINYIIE